MKDVPGFPPYKVDRYGNVYGFRGKMSPKRKKDGYMQVKLSHEPKPLYRSVWNHCHGIKSNSEGYAFRWGEE